MCGWCDLLFPEAEWAGSGGGCEVEQDSGDVDLQGPGQAVLQHFLKHGCVLDPDQPADAGQGATRRDQELPALGPESAGGNRQNRG